MPNDLMANTALFIGVRENQRPSKAAHQLATLCSQMTIIGHRLVQEIPIFFIIVFNVVRGIPRRVAVVLTTPARSQDRAGPTHPIESILWKWDRDLRTLLWDSVF